MKVLNRIANIVLSLFGILVLYILLKVFVFDSFPVNTHSMTPTIQPGDRILVNKTIFGARIYKNLDFEEGKPLESWRMPGFRKIRHNDIVVFNFILGKENPHRMSFNFTTVYVKRCVGLPGDTLSIRGGFFHNTGTDRPLGLREAQERMSRTDLGRLFEMKIYVVQHTDPATWTLHDFGPVYIPRKGDVIDLGPGNYLIYRNIIEFESQGTLTTHEGQLLLDGNPLTRYEFRENYYFMCGDYLENSVDSRTWGFVPEDFIIGVAPRVLYAKNPDDTLNWSRFLKRLR